VCAAENGEAVQRNAASGDASFSNFGSTPHPLTEKVRQAAQLVHKPIRH